MKDRMHPPTAASIPAATSPLFGTANGNSLTARALEFSREIRERIDRQIGRDAARTHAFRRQSTGQ